MGAFRRRLGQFLKSKGIKPTTLSLKIGRSPTLVRDLMEKTSDVKLSTVSKIAAELGISVNDLLTSDAELTPIALGPRLYVKGVVSAGDWVEAFELPQEDWVVFMGREGVTAEPDHRFGLRVKGDSMDEIYPEGTIIECVSVFGRTEPMPGKKVVVIRTRHDGLVEATVKELAEVDGEIWLRPRSRNPIHQAFKLNGDDPEIVETRIAAVVVSSVREE